MDMKCGIFYPGIPKSWAPQNSDELKFSEDSCELAKNSQDSVNLVKI